MAPLPSPPVTGRESTLQKPPTKLPTSTTASTRRPGSAASVRRPPSATSTRNGTPRTQQQNAASTRLAAPKARGSADKENESTARLDRPIKRQSTANVPGREKPPSKDGTAQKNAKEVEGLKDYVSDILPLIQRDEKDKDAFVNNEVLLSNRAVFPTHATSNDKMNAADLYQQLGDCLGRGAFGSVYRALNWSTGETVAIKQVRLADLPKTELNVIMQEIDLLKNLNHPNIVKYQGFVKSTDSLYIILEYCENGSLHTICKNFGKFPENLVGLYTTQVLQGLHFLHEQGVIHRDIKGANILTTKEGLVKLADFGVATKQQGLSEGSVVGTPYWMAPEVIELSGASTASDIWSLGCTVIELLDGKPPYHQFAPMPALFRIVNEDHPPLPEGVSPLARDFLMQCFQKDPNLRVSAKKLLRHPWILSSKKGHTQPVVPPEDAVKYVQDWNDWLRSTPKEDAREGGGSRRASTRMESRPTSRSDGKGLRQQRQETPPAKAKGGFQLGKHRNQPTKQYASPENDDKRDNWDDDFDSMSTSPARLQLPDHFKSQDTLGLFSSEKLKQYASFDGMPEMDGKVEEWDREFEGELTVRSPLQLAKGDAVETVRPFYPSRTTSDEIKHKPPQGVAKQSTGGEQHERRGSKDSQPKTQILRPTHKPNAPSKAKHAPPQPTKRPAPVPTAAGKESYREEVEEDYSDLVADDEDAFRQKLARFSPSRPFNHTELRRISTKIGGTSRRRTHTPTNLVHDAAAMKRTRSSLEMQKYAEDDHDEDFADVDFGEDDGAPMALHPVKTRSPQSASAGSESIGSERGTLKLSGSLSWLGDEEDDDYDPFAALEVEFDEVDLESNVARDKHARLCTLVENLVTDLKLSQPEDVLVEIVDQLLQILYESPDVKSIIVSSHGMLPILEILDTCSRPPTILRLLKIVNCIISDNVEVQENLCFVGGIPIISKFAHKKYSSDIRLEAAAFVRMMYQTSTLTLQMFVSCGGLNVLVEFLEEDYDNDAGRELVLVGVNGVWSVFELQGPTPKNDFCRIFSRSSVLYPLSLVLNRVLDEEDALAEVYEGRIVNIFLLFSQAENHVKETVADRMVLKRVLKDLRRMRPQHQITMLKFIKNLSMLASTLDALQNSNAIEVLTDLLGASMHVSHFREISNQVLNTMYNLCRLSKARQEDAALSGVIPMLQRIVQTERPLKEFALPILCDMAHSGKVGRKVLWQNKGLQFYVGLLADQYWAVTALDAIFIWLQEETAKVEEHLLSTRAFSDAIMQCFNESKADAFENLLEPLQKLLRLSPPVAASLAQRSLFQRSAVKLHAKKPLVRLNLLRVIRSICDASDEQGALLATHGLLDSVQDLAKTDPAILVREMANELVKSSEYAVASSAAAVRYAGVRRSSSSTMTPPPPPPASAVPSMPPTPGSSSAVDRTGGSSSASARHNGYFDLGIDMNLLARSATTAPRPMTSSPYRPVSRDGSAGSSSSSAAAVAAAAANLTSLNHPHHQPAPKPPGRLVLPAQQQPQQQHQHRSSLTRTHQSRFSLAMQGTPVLSRVGEGKVVVPETPTPTPTHAPPPLSSANPRGSSVAMMAHARRRRQTSGGGG